MKMVDGYTCPDTHKACLHIWHHNSNCTIYIQVGTTNRLGTAMNHEIFIEMWRRIFLPKLFQYNH